MDPATGFSLAVNLITLIEFIGKIAHKSYSALHGTDQDLNDIEVSAERIESSLEQLLVFNQQSNRQTTILDENIRKISEECQSIAVDVVKKIRGFNVHKGASRIQKVQAILRLVRELFANKYKDLNERLKRYREQLDSHLLMSISLNVRILQDSLYLMNSRLGTLEGSLISNPVVLTERPTYEGVADAVTRRGTLIKFIHQSLDFEGIKIREESILDVSEDSYSWIFSEPHQFFKWLKSGAGIEDPVFWVHGIPGSGKSTMLKGLSRHSQTQKSLDYWGQCTESTVLTLTHFFEYSGTLLQKNREGMLRNLLHQVCTVQPAIQQYLFEQHIDELDLRPRTDYLNNSDSDGSRKWNIPSWTMTRLSKLVLRLQSYLSTRKLKLCIFIDGLDECMNQQHLELIQDIQTLIGSQGDIKCCLSSRHWPVFRDAFSRRPNLPIHKYTGSTIIGMITEMLFSHLPFQNMIKRRPERAERLVQNVNSKANGSVIWVKLALRSLMQGFTDGDTFGELNSRLNELPEDLEELYNITLDRVPGRYKQDTALIMLLTSHFSRSDFFSDCLNLFVFCLARDISKRGYEAVDADCALFPHCYDFGDIERVLESRTGTLVEIRPFNPGHTDLNLWSNQMSQPSPCFIHRTITDYINKHQTQAKLRCWLDNNDWHPQEAVARAQVLRISRISDTSEDFHKLMYSCMKNITALEWPDVGLWEQLKSALRRLFQAQGAVSSAKNDRDDVSSLWGEDFYVHRDDVFSLCGEYFYVHRNGTLRSSRRILRHCEKHWSECDFGLFLASSDFQALDLYFRFHYRKRKGLDSKPIHIWSRDDLTTILATITFGQYSSSFVDDDDDDDLQDALNLGADPNKFIYQRWSPWLIWLCHEYIMTLEDDLTTNIPSIAHFLRCGAKRLEDCEITLQNHVRTCVIPYVVLSDLFRNGRDPFIKQKSGRYSRIGL